MQELNSTLVVEAARSRLRELGITVELESVNTSGTPPEPDVGIDAIATLSRADSRARYALVVKEPMTLSSVAHRPPSAAPYPLLIIGDRITRRSAAAFHDAGVQFVDTQGNAFITFGNVLLDVQGRSDVIPERNDRKTRQPHPANLFSARRSQVILALLTWPELSSGSVRETARAAGVSVGQAHDALVQLGQTGFLSTQSRRLDRTNELLDYWTAAYPTGLGRRLQIAVYHGDPAKPISTATADQPIYLSSESAEGLDVARPATLTVYFDGLDPKVPILNRWSSSPDRVPNVFIRRKFWVSPRPDENQPSVKIHNAPWPLVYADLMATGDARLGEVARTWRIRNARPDEM